MAPGNGVTTLSTRRETAPDAYPEYRRALLVHQMESVVPYLVGSILFFEVLFALLLPAGFVEQGWQNAFLLAVAISGIGVYSRFFRASPDRLVLLADLGFTLTIVTRLFEPSAWTSGIALFLSIKSLATAMLIPWQPRTQLVSSILALLSYWAFLYASGRAEHAGGELAHQVTGPFFAFALSNVGTLLADRLRRDVFVQTRERQRQARVSEHFAATMTHELRGLLASVDGYGDMLGTTASTRAEVDSIAARLRILAREGLEIIGVTLALSHAGRTRDDSDFETVRLGRLFEELRDEFVAPGPSIELRWEVHDESLMVHTDPVKLKMIVRNLVGNALKFTEQGSVAVRSAIGVDGLELHVVDTGVGIAPAAQERIFEPFHQVDPKSGGAGLGLYVVRRLVDELGGRIALTSVVGVGSTFVVRLPTPTGG